MAGRSVSKQRQQEALKLLGDGYGCTELTAKLADQWGCSRRQSRRYVAAAYAELVADFTEVEAADMLAQIINRLETVARKAAEQGQHACVIGACKLLAELAVTPHRSRPPAHFGRFGRSGSWN
ncbi:MAG: hypothetical protein FJ057_07360 [Cyanobacteria bacterium K_DeepCast_0m_m1_088]|nr:hypothetical protein [Cyanobacteria bacterium K_DeepCast_0m_m1_088]